MSGREPRESITMPWPFIFIFTTLTNPQKYRSKRLTQAERSHMTRTRILDSTLDCIEESGLQHASTVVIARRAGVSRGALLHHFPTKLVLLQEALRHLLKREIRNVQKIMTDLVRSKTTYQEVLDILWEHFSGRLFMITIEYLAAARTDAAIRKTLNAVGMEFNDSLDAIWDKLPLNNRMSIEERRIAFNATLCFLRGMGTQTVWRDDPQLFLDMLRFWKENLERLGVIGPPGKSE